MRVLIIPSWYPTAEKPVNGIFIREQADALSRLHDVRVLYLDVLPRGERRKPRRTMTRECGYVEETIEVPNRRFVWQFAYLWQMARALWRIRRRFRPEVAHCHIAVPAAWAASLLKPLLRVPLVLTEHSSEFGSWMSRPGLRWMARRGMHGVHLVIAVSEGQKKNIEATFPNIKKLAVVSNLVNTGRFHFAPMPATDRGYRLIFVGLLDTDQKGLHVLLEALGHLRADLPNLHLKVVGDGKLRRLYEEQAETLGINQMVSFLGRLPNSEVANLVRESHALVMPSLHESQGIVALEALATGRPVIATRCGGPEYIIDVSNGKIAEPGKMKPLATAITEVLLNLSGYNPAKIAANTANQYNPEAIVGKLSKIYKQLTPSD
jgi:L-malate glycosyltransferase